MEQDAKKQYFPAPTGWIPGQRTLLLSEYPNGAQQMVKQANRIALRATRRHTRVLPILAASILILAAVMAVLFWI